MRRRVIGSVLAACMAMALAPPPHAFGYTLTGIRWKSNSSTWPQYRVYVDYHTMPSDWRTEAYEARLEWDNSGASKEYFYYSNTSGQELYRGAYGNTSWLALTTVASSGGLISDVGTKVNTDFAWNVAGTPTPTQYDLQSVLTHELGHWLYLEHTPVSLATMVSRHTIGTWWQRTLASDDIAGIRAIYGAK